MYLTRKPVVLWDSIADPLETTCVLEESATISYMGQARDTYVCIFPLLAFAQQKLLDKHQSSQSNCKEISVIKYWDTLSEKLLCTSYVLNTLHKFSHSALTLVL